MTSPAAISGTVARRYAAAFVEMAADSKALEAIEKDLNDLEAMAIASADLQSLIYSPMFSKADQHAGLQALADKAKFHQLTKNFIKLLVENRRLPAVYGIVHAVRADLSRRRGEVTATIESAYALSAAQTKELQKSLSDAMGQNVTLNVSVNKDLIGGLVVTVGSQMIDDSVKRKLERLGRAMQSGSNQNTAQKEAV